MPALPTNAQRIIDMVRQRQQAGQPNDIPLSERQKQGTARTPNPFDTPGISKPTSGPGYVGDTAAIEAKQKKDREDWQKFQATQASNAESDRKFKAQKAIDDEEKNRKKGRASTMVTGGLGDTSRANIGRATLMGN